MGTGQHVERDLADDHLMGQVEVVLVDEQDAQDVPGWLTAGVDDRPAPIDQWLDELGIERPQLLGDLMLVRLDGR